MPDKEHEEIEQEGFFDNLDKVGMNIIGNEKEAYINELIRARKKKEN